MWDSELGTNTIRCCQSGRFCSLYLWSLRVKPVSGIIHSLRKSPGMIPSSFRLCLINFLDEISSRNLWIIGNVLCKASDTCGHIACLHSYQLWMKGRLSLHYPYQHWELSAFSVVSSLVCENLMLCFNSHFLVGLTIFCYWPYSFCVKCLFLVLAFFSVSGFGILFFFWISKITCT